MEEKTRGIRGRDTKNVIGLVHGQLGSDKTIGSCVLCDAKEYWMCSLSLFTFHAYHSFLLPFCMNVFLFLWISHSDNLIFSHFRVPLRKSGLHGPHPFQGHTVVSRDDWCFGVGC